MEVVLGEMGVVRVNRPDGKIDDHRARDNRGVGGWRKFLVLSD